MMIKRFMTTFATVALGSVAGISLAAAQGYPTASPSGYSIPAEPGYTPGGYAAGPRGNAMDAMPDFDALDEDDAPQSRSPRPQGGLSAPGMANQGPVMSPDDPRYGRPAGAPVYSDRPVQQGAQVPQGPVMSPDDPRYGRPAGSPSVIYSDRGNYPDRGEAGMRPPEAVGGQGYGGQGYGAPVTGSVQPGQRQNLGANGSSVMVASLP